jgi:CBS domain-containing protein
MLVRDLMTTDIASVSPDTPVGVVVHLLAERGISGVPVMDADGVLLGMVTEGDLMRRLALSDEPRHGWFWTPFDDQVGAAERSASVRGAAARDVMTARPLTVTEGTNARHAARLMDEHEVRRLPVLRDGRVIGVVSRSDLLPALLPASSNGADAPEEPDQAIRGAIAARMRRETWARAPCLSFEVQGGVVRFHGSHGSDATRRATYALASGVPGVVRVVDHATELPSGNVGLM